MGIVKTRNEISEGLPELIDIFCGLGKVVGVINLGIAKLTELVNGELETLFVLVDEAFDFEEIVLLKGFEDVVDVVPHFGF